MIERICVFCGSSSGEHTRYLEAASALGLLLADEGIDLIYGGSRLGLMGRLADTVLRHGGQVTGVIPEALTRREVAHQDLSELLVVDSMHERKRIMAELADAFAVLPGGLGTLEEFLEVLTWSQLGLHNKPMGILEVGGYFKPFINLLDHMVQQGFLSSNHRRMVVVETDPERLLERLRSYVAPPVPKWIEQGQT